MTSEELVREFGHRVPRRPGAVAPLHRLDVRSRFDLLHRNINEALKATGIVEGDSTLNKNAKSAALSAFEGAKQRFFGHLLTAMKCPSLIRAIEADLDTGRSAVIQLVSTGEALMERRIAEIPASEWDDLSVDLTPRETVIEFLAHAFPVQLQEPFTDDEGNVMSRPVFDDDGNCFWRSLAIRRSRSASLFVNGVRGSVRNRRHPSLCLRRRSARL